MEKGSKRGLRKGFTTGTSAAAGAKAATVALFTGKLLKQVEVTLPRAADGVLKVPVREVHKEPARAVATIVKDAGDDPDVTDKALIVTEVRLITPELPARARIEVRGGPGVGRVTRPGLSVAPGRPAINPVPLKMIRLAVGEELRLLNITPSLTVTVSVPMGVELASKTMNARLGIIGGISILGTTGIVEPMSLSAYRHSISSALDVAAAAGLEHVVLSTGRSSEKALEKALALSEAAYILTGDHMGFALAEAALRKTIKEITVAGQFGKFSKLAFGHMATHCKESSIELPLLAELAGEKGCGAGLSARIAGANTAREVFLILKEKGRGDIITELTRRVKENASLETGAAKRLNAVLVGYNGNIEVSL